MSIIRCYKCECQYDVDFDDVQELHGEDFCINCYLELTDD